MSETPSTVDDALSQSLLEQVDAICDRFEDAWLAGQRPCIEDYLAEVADERLREALVKELIALDIYHRQKRGETIHSHDYQRFAPQAAGWLVAEASTNAAAPERYRLGDKIGIGGMGEVRRSRDLCLNRDLAIKMLLPEHRGHAQMQQRFLDEARIGGRLQHPGIVPVHDIGALSDGRPFFTMKLVEGRTLAALLAERLEPSHDLPHFLSIYEQICQTLAYAHAQGVIHRDLKPANIMVGAFGEVQVMDWGLAKVLKRDPAEETAADGATVIYLPAAEDTSSQMRTQPGQAMGTYAYMPPEQACGEVARVDERSDVFGLGAILCEILTGRPPFTGSTSHALFARVKACDHSEGMARLDACGADAELQQLARACLAAEPAARPRHAGEVAAAVKVYLEGVQKRLHAAERDRAAEQARAEEAKATALAERRARRRTRALAVVVTIASLLIIATLAVSTVLISQSLTTAEEAQQKAEKEQVKAEQEQAKTAAALRRETTALEARTGALKAVQAEKQQTQTALERERCIAYAYRINLAQRAWRDSQVVRVLELLQSSLSPLGEPDGELCGFEWHYLRRLCHQEERTLRGNIRQLCSIAFSTDGRLLAAAGRWVRNAQQRHRGPIIIWDASTGQEIFTLGDPAESYMDLAFSPDGKQLAARTAAKKAFGPSKITVWDTSTGRQRLSLSRIGGGITYSPDGKYLAMTSKDEVVLCDAASGQEMGKLAAKSAILAFSPDGTRLATNDTDRSLPQPKPVVKIWDLQSREVVRTLLGSEDIIKSIVFSPDGRVLASGGLDKTVRLWDVATGNLLHALKGHTGDVYSLAFSPDSQNVASADFGWPDGDDQARCVKVWDVVSGREVRTLRGHTGAVTGVAYSPDGKLASCSLDGTVKIWGREAGREARLFHKGRVARAGLATGNDGKLLACGEEDHITVYNLHSGKVHRKLAHPLVYSVALSSDGQTLASATANWNNWKPELRCIKVWNLQTGKERWSRPGKQAWQLNISRDGKYLASADGDKRTATIWDAATGHVFRTLGHADFVQGVAFSPDSRQLATASRDGVRLWDIATGIGQKCPDINADDSPYRVTFSPDGRRLAAALNTRQNDRGGSVGTIQVWDTLTKKTVLTLRGHTRQILSLAFSPDGQRLATGSDDRSVKIWDMVSGQELLSLPGHTGGVNGLVFSTDGYRLFTSDTVIGSTLSKTLFYDYEAHRTYGIRMWDATPLPKEVDAHDPK